MDFTALKTAIQNAVKLNGNEEITGDILQGVLLSMVSTLGDSAINDLVTAISNEATARQNGDSTLNGYITALQGAVNSINTAIGNGYVYAGIATPTTTPATGKVFYIALTAGTYTNFGNTEVSQGINILKYDGSDWSLDVVIALDDAPTPSSNNLVKSGGIYEEIGKLGQMVSVSFDYQDSYINTNGTISNSGAVNWWITGYVSILPNTSIKGKIYTMTGVLCVAFYDKDKKFISGIQSDSSSYEWKEIDAVAPSNAYYIIGGSRVSNIPNYDSIIFIIPPLGFNKAVGWDEMTEKIRTFVVDTNPEFDSFKLKSPNTNDKTIVVNSYNFDDSQYSNLLFMHPNGFVNLRATNVELGDNKVLILSKSSSSLQRYSSVDELPSTGPNADVYLFPADISGYRNLSWDIVYFNFNGQLINLLLGNTTLAEDGFPTVGDLKKGLFLQQTFDKNGYLDVDGKFHSTTAWICTDYIKVRGGERIIGTVFGAENATCLVAYYDEYFDTLGIIESTIPSSGGAESFNAIIPKNVRYIRFCSKAGEVALAYIGARILVNDDDKYKYGHNLKKPYDFNGKTAVFFGDSITHGVASTPTTLIGIEDCYRNVFSEKAEMTNIDRAISGSFLYDTNYDGTNPDEDSILSQVKQYITAQSNYDFIFIAGGVNDFVTGKNLGTIDDVGNISVYGALKGICEHLKSVAPDIPVIFLTPINYSRVADNATPYIPLNYYRNAIFEVAAMNDYTVVDMSVVGFPNEPDDTAYKAAVIRDGCHPTELGHKMMGEMLYSILS